MKFKIGDKIKVKSYDEIRDYNRSAGFRRKISFNSSTMKRYCGKVLTVSSGKYEDVVKVYVLDECDRWIWDENWLELYVEPVQLPEELFIL